MPQTPSRGRSPFVAAVVAAEPLEGRQLLAAQVWSPEAKLMGQDQAATNFPNLTGAGETVVVIDSGVDYNHPSLGGGLGGSHKVIAGYDFMSGDSNPFPDTFAHGTGAAGVIAADPYTFNGTYHRGIAPGVHLIALRQSNSSQVKAALQWVLDNRAKYNIVAVNLTDYGGPSPATYQDVFKKVVAAGVFVAHPSGNEGPTKSVGSAIDPADFSVGSVDLSGQMSSFTQRGAELDLVAPGKDVAITYYDVATKKHIYTTSWGTSWASPAVTGTAALIKQIDAKFTPAQIMKIMQDSGTAVYDGVSKLTYKRLNVNAALTLAYQRKGTGTQSTPPPTPAPTPTPTPSSKPAPTPAPKPVPKPPPPPTQTPFSGTPIRIGALVGPTTTIEAENFDNGGEGLAYHDTEATNYGKNTYRGTAGVDVQASMAGGREVTIIRPGEWLEYTVTVATAGTYTLGAKMSVAPQDGGAFHLEVDGVDKTGTLLARGTSTAAYAVVAKDGVALTAGTHVLRFSADAVNANGSGLLGNLDSLQVTLPPPTIDATKISSQKGAAITADHVGALAQGDFVGYKAIDFGPGKTSFSALVAAPKGFAGGQIEIRIGSPTGSVIGLLTVGLTASWDTYRWQTTSILKTTGVHDVFLTFVGSGWIGNIRSLKFA